MLCFACSLIKKETPMLYSPIALVQRVQLGRGSKSKTTTNQTLLKMLFFSSTRLAPPKHLPPVFFEGRWSRNKQTSFPAPIPEITCFPFLPLYRNQNVSEKIQNQNISLPHLPCAVQAIWAEQVSVLDCCHPPDLSDKDLPAQSLRSCHCSPLGFHQLVHQHCSFPDTVKHNRASILSLPAAFSGFPNRIKEITMEPDIWCSLIGVFLLLCFLPSLPAAARLVCPCLPREQPCAAPPLSRPASLPCTGPTAARMDLYRCSAWLSSSSDCLAIRASVSFRAGKQKCLNGGDRNAIIQCLSELTVLLVQADFGRKSNVKNQ